MGGFDGYESLNTVEVLDLNSKDSAKFEMLDIKMPSRIKNGVAIMNENDQSVYMFGGWDEKETLSSVFRFDT